MVLYAFDHFVYWIEAYGTYYLELDLGIESNLGSICNGDWNVFAFLFGDASCCIFQMD